jgi:ferredoxin-NADP reductase
MRLLMNEYRVKILDIENVARDVKSIKVEKPEGFIFNPGQATDLSINKPGLIGEKRPFTFTGLNEWNFLEFTIKIYRDHDGVTNKIGTLQTGEELIIGEPWGSIGYKGEGVFIAGGAGITPFIAIIRDLKSKKMIGGSKLIFANKTSSDIIRRDEFENMLGKNFINILSGEELFGYKHGFITEEFLLAVVDDPSKMFYLCGPPPMMEAVEKILANIGVQKDSIIKEDF